jgi:hypothetical protein
MRDTAGQLTDGLHQLGVEGVVVVGVVPADDARLDKHPEIVLLFTDVGLPGVNGRQLGDEARQRVPDLKVLYTTGPHEMRSYTTAGLIRASIS